MLAGAGTGAGARLGCGVLVFSDENCSSMLLMLCSISVNWHKEHSQGASTSGLKLSQALMGGQRLVRGVDTRTKAQGQSDSALLRQQRSSK